MNLPIQWILAIQIRWISKHYYKHYTQLQFDRNLAVKSGYCIDNAEKPVKVVIVYAPISGGDLW